MLFKDIIGQEELKRHLLRTASAGRISHAQLFLGPEGSGSLPLALAYAQYINCLNRLDHDSCGECASCRKYNKLIHPDLHFSFPFFSSSPTDHAALFLDQWRTAFLKNPYLNIDSWRAMLDGGNKQANINIAECHQIIQKLSLKAFEAKFKVLIMWLPEFMDRSGNALLKLIEEPPENTLFLLVTQNQEKILTTIVSRTQLVKVNPVNKASLAKMLVDQHRLTDERAMQIAYISNGNVQAALMLIGDDENNYFDLLVRWFRMCFGAKMLDLINLVEHEIAKLGRENQKSFLHYALNIMREVILFKEGATGLIHVPAAELSFIEKFSPLHETKQLERCVRLFEKTSYYIERNANPKILFLDVSLQMISLFKR